MGQPGGGIFSVEAPLSQMTMAYVQLIENYDMSKFRLSSCLGAVMA